MFCPSTQPSCLIDSQNWLVETDCASSCGLGAGPMLRIPTRTIFSDFCASAANGVARKTAPVPARNVRRSIIRPYRSIEPSSPPKAELLSQEPRNVLPDLPPRLGRPREGAHVSEGH